MAQRAGQKHWSEVLVHFTGSEPVLLPIACVGICHGRLWSVHKTQTERGQATRRQGSVFRSQ